MKGTFQACKYITLFSGSTLSKIWPFVRIALNLADKVSIFMFCYTAIKSLKMSYYIETKLHDINFEDAIEKVTAELKKEGFGVLTEIDLKSTLKKKLDVDFYNYRILGACNPPYAHKALLAENKIGTMLPCNVIVQERNPGEVEISAVDPIASMQAIENPELGELAQEIRDKLQAVIDSVQ